MKASVIIALLFVASSAFAWEPRPDFVNYIKKVENAQRVGRNSSGVWFPHRSFEGGMPTIGYGHKVANEKELKMAQAGFSDAHVTKVLQEDLKRAYSQARSAIAKSHNRSLDDMPEWVKEVCVDYFFNLGGRAHRQFPNFFSGLLSLDKNKMQREYKRFSCGHELTGRNRAFATRYLANQ